MINAPSIDTLNEARKNANRVRTNALMLVADGLLTPVQIVEQAATSAGRPLRKVTLYQLLMNQPGWGRTRAHEVIAKVADMSEVAPDPRDLTIRWLISHRSHGRRLQNLIDTVPKQVGYTPWPGFPLHQGPNYD